MSNSTFIDLHEQMNTKGWIPDWEFNEPINLYKYDGCTTISEVSSTNSNYASDVNDNGAWIYHLGSLTNGNRMFYNSTLESFSGDLSSLTYGLSMFQNTTLGSFSGDLTNLNIGQSMFRNSALTSFNGDLSRMTNAHAMFFNTPLESFNGDLSSLSDGYHVFFMTALTSFSGDLSSLTNGQGMFYRTPLDSFSGDLPKLTNGSLMFCNTALTSFNCDVPKLTYGQSMFNGTALTSFSGDLSKLTDGYQMFCNTYARTYDISYYKMENGVKKQVTTSITATGLKTFNSNLSSLKSGYQMFGNYSTTCSPLSEESIMIIADTINDISTLNKSDNSNWEYTYHNGSTPTTASIASEHRGILHLGYDKSITDTTNIMKYCDKIAAKGWTVYLNAALQVANNGAIETIPLTDENGSPVVIPHYYKPVQVTDEEVGEYIDDNGKFYIIVGGQHVFGDDISSYGMFTSYEHAVSEISLGLGLAPCEKPDEEIIEEEFTEE